MPMRGVGAWWADRQASERDKERAVAVERDRQEALAALDHAQELLSGADLALNQAADRVAADAPAALRDRLTAAQRDRDLIRDLREIEDLSWAPGRISMLEPAVMAGRYR